MMSMLGGTGMGAAGTGMGAGPQMPGGTLSPQLLAMLAQMQPQGGSPAAPGNGATPMAGYIGAGGNAGAMHAPMAPPIGQPPGMNGQAAPGAAPMPGGISPQMLQMLQQLKGQQGGVPANLPPMQGPAIPGQTPGSQVPSPMQGPTATGAPMMASGADPNWWQMMLQRLGGGGAMGGMPSGGG